MAKRNKKQEDENIMAQSVQVVQEINNTQEILEKNTETLSEKTEKIKKTKKEPKFKIGDLVYVSSEVEADLNGFNLSISQFKNNIYTVEAYDENTGVYKLRHNKLLICLKESNLVAPDENAHDSLNRKQF